MSFHQQYTTTLESLRARVERFQPDDPVGQCYKTSDELAIELEREGFSPTVEYCEFTGLAVGGEGIASHWYVRLPSEAVEDVPDGVSVILDPTNQQFTKELYCRRDVGAYVPANLRPGCGVIRSDSEYSAPYQQQRVAG